MILLVELVEQTGYLFITGPVTDYASAKASDTEVFARYFRFMLERGIYLAPSQFEAMFVSTAHTDDDLDTVIAAVQDYLSL